MNSKSTRHHARQVERTSGTESKLWRFSSAAAGWNPSLISPWGWDYWEGVGQANKDGIFNQQNVILQSSKSSYIVRLSCHHFHFLWCNEWVTWKSSWWSASDTIGSSLSSSSTESLQNLSWVKLNAICQSKVKTQTYNKQTNKKNISPKLLSNPVKSWIQRILNLWICPLDEIMMIIYTHQCER